MTTPTHPIPLPISAMTAADRRSRRNEVDEHASVGGVPVSVTTLRDAVEWLHDWTVQRRGGVSVRLVNAFTVVSAHRDPAYLRLLRSAGVSLPDGTPVMLALRAIAHRRRAGRVRGPSFFVRSLERGQGAGVREFFLGTTDETLSALSGAVEERFPGAEIAGTWAPPFVERVDEAFVERCSAHVGEYLPSRVWVALGTPKQDHLAQALAERLGVPCIAVGAAFDFVAGTKREAPKLLQAIGAEWVFRLMSEPQRLWRRYVFGNLAFLGILLRERG